ncbi:unnamed protein product [Larinioides sclopetarius]|uniref:Uncharacterized protein n=1 Tax=Larinioides sclopetarius TaxID=280406 RepID=A0AAV1YU11_9ARAC
MWQSLSAGRCDDYLSGLLSLFPLVLQTAEWTDVGRLGLKPDILKTSTECAGQIVLKSRNVTPFASDVAWNFGEMSVIPDAFSLPNPSSRESLFLAFDSTTKRSWNILYCTLSGSIPTVDCRCSLDLDAYNRCSLSSELAKSSALYGEGKKTLHKTFEEDKHKTVVLKCKTRDEFKIHPSFAVDAKKGGNALTLEGLLNPKASGNEESITNEIIDPLTEVKRWIPINGISHQPK